MKDLIETFVTLIALSVFVLIGICALAGLFPYRPATKTGSAREDYQSQIDDLWGEHTNIMNNTLLPDNPDREKIGTHLANAFQKLEIAEAELAEEFDGNNILGLIEQAKSELNDAQSMLGGDTKITSVLVG